MIFTCHLRSQRLGRTICLIDIGTGDVGTICLRHANSEWGPIRFAFSILAIVSIAGTGRQWIELAARIAVTHAHLLHRDARLDAAGRALPLRTELRPWIGDLSFTPLRSAGTGSGMPQSAGANDRRGAQHHTPRDSNAPAQ